MNQLHFLASSPFFEKVSLLFFEKLSFFSVLTSIEQTLAEYILFKKLNKKFLCTVGNTITTTTSHNIDINSEYFQKDYLDEYLFWLMLSFWSGFRS